MSAASYIKDTYFRFLRTTAFEAGFGSEWLPRDQAIAVFEDAYVSAFNEVGFAPKPPPFELIEETISYLKEAGGLEVEGDEYTGEFWKLHGAKKDAAVVSHLRSDPVSLRISKLGHPALQIALEKISEELGWPDVPGSAPQANDQAVVSGEYRDDAWTVPASDRVVSRTDNLPVIEEIQGTIAEIRKDLCQDNQVGDFLGDEREILDLELSVADRVVESPKFRVKSLLGWLLPALKFIADKFAGTGISEAAKHLWTLLVSLI